MSMGVLGLVLAYMALGLLLLNLCFRTSWPLSVKVMTTICMGCFYIVSYLSWLAVQGWPSDDHLPKHTLVLASYIVEPNLETGQDGYIYVWADDVSSGHPMGQPRAYRVEYNADLHERFLNARKRSNEGVFQIMTQATKKDDGPLGAMARLFGQQKSQKLDIRDLPDPALPGK